MKNIFLILFFLAYFSKAKEPRKEENVYVLNSSNFDEFLKANQNVFVYFFSLNCVYCTQLSPEFSFAAMKLKDKNVKLAKVNGQTEKLLSERY